MFKLEVFLKDYQGLSSSIKLKKGETLFQKVCDIEGVEYNKNSHFKNYGVMIDLSRGAVFKVDYLLNILVKLSMAGVNTVWLYLEDGYEIDQPFFGYLRGKYTAKELRDIDEFAHELGIEIVMCIQTLGHLGTFLRWPVNTDYYDQSTVLLSKSDKTYELIGKMLDFCKNNLRSTKIHVGMDETYGLGRGQYLDKYGLRPQIDIFLEHLTKVRDMALERGFTEVMFWSDMVFQTANGHKGYYHVDTPFSKEVIAKIPKGVKLVYWDYYHEKYDIVDKMIKRHFELSPNLIMASGLWTWSRHIADDYYSGKRVSNHLKVLEDNNLDEIILCMWNDNGSYVDFETVFYGLLKATAQIYTLTNKDIEKIYRYMFKKELKDLILIEKINHVKVGAVGLLYDDPILGIYLNNEMALDKNNLVHDIKHYQSLKNVNGYSEYNNLKEILRLKLELRLRLLDSYFNQKDMILLIPDYKALIKHLEDYFNAFKARWMKNYLPYGFELHDMRINGQIARIKTLIKRIRQQDEFIELKEYKVKHQWQSTHFEFVYSPNSISIF